MSHLNPRWTRILPAALLLTASTIQAQEAASPDLDELRQQLQQARTELTEAARRMAEIQRQLAPGEGGRSFVWHSDSDGEERLIEHHVERVISGLQDQPPRLGVLLGAGADEDPRTVLGITPGSGAETAGIRRGDVLVRINGREIPDDAPESVREALQGLEPGATIPVELRRGDQSLELGVTLNSPGDDVRMIVRRFSHGDAPELEIEEIREITGPGDAPMPPLPPGIHGFGLPQFSALGRDIDLIGNHDGLASYFGTGEGVLVLRVADDNAFGLHAGDVILSVDREAIASPVALGRHLIGLEGGSEVVLEVMRAGSMIQLSGTLPERDPRLGLRSHRTDSVISMHSIAPPVPPMPPAPATPY